MVFKNIVSRKLSSTTSLGGLLLSGEHTIKRDSLHPYSQSILEVIQGSLEVVRLVLGIH